MHDAHIHIEQGPYTIEWIWRFIEAAQAAHLDRIFLLEHSSRFRDFFYTYTSVFDHLECGAYQTAWLEKKCTQQLAYYQKLIEQIKNQMLPIEVCFGLEVCYFPEKEDMLRQILSAYPWDFLTGSIHWLDGWGFDHLEQRHTWQDKDVNRVYRQYYQRMIQLADSRLFDIVAHPDSIKCCNYYPTIDLRPEYRELARALIRNNMAAEQSGGLRLNYDHSELGMNPALLEILLEEGVPIVTASDAHKPEDVGKNISELTQIVKTKKR